VVHVNNFSWIEVFSHLRHVFEKFCQNDVMCSSLGLNESMNGYIFTFRTSIVYSMGSWWNMGVTCLTNYSMKVMYVLLSYPYLIQNANIYSFYSQIFTPKTPSSPEVRYTGTSLEGQNDSPYPLHTCLLDNSDSEYKTYLPIFHTQL
jgi:hypothetical protein